VSGRRFAVRSLLSAATAGHSSYRGLSRTAMRSDPTWLRTNYRGREVDLLGGPALVIAALAGLARLPAGRLRRGAVIALLGAGACGAADDLLGDTGTRGLGGHLAALADGRVTTGNLKIVGIGAAGLLAAATATGTGIVRSLPAGLVVALAANTANLLDLRPGRVGKVALLVGVPMTLAGGPGSRLAGVATGSAAGLLPADLAERTMLGDTGANALGALLGLATVTGASRRRVYAVLGLLAGLTAASEVVSFSAVIDRNQPLRHLDRLGRRADQTDV
jgi:UDP-GlcNAc:undecaprenyl-phosphate GlcNAc-1-phosphate transferase